MFITEPAAIAAIKAGEQIKAGRRARADLPRADGRGHGGDLPDHVRAQVSRFGKHVAVLTDARFSGVSTGACIGHVWPEALAGGPIGKVRDGDLIRIVIDRDRLEGTVDLVGERRRVLDAGGRRARAGRDARRATDLAADPELPDDTRLWAALQDVSGGTWGGCVYDVDAILEVLAAGQRALGRLGQGSLAGLLRNAS